MNPRSNQLLEQLIDTEYQWLHRDLHLVSLQVGQNLFTPGGRIDQAYFPANALIAIANQMPDGLSMDMAVVGPEAAIGLRGLFDNTCPYRVHVAQSGLAYRIALSKLRPFLEAGACWLHRMYVQTNHRILAQIATETTCAHFHCVTERLARWLLLRTELAGQPGLEATHQSIADSLGIRREAVTHALVKMPGVSCCRSRIEISDRPSLEQVACDCYRQISTTSTPELSLPLRQLA